MDVLQVLIVDDHPIFRSGMCALLSSVSGMEVAGEATSEDEAVAKAEQLQPDIVLMDLEMPGGNGIKAIQRILHSNPHIHVLVVTMFEDNERIFAALRVGAHGYILKGAQPAEIVRAIQAVGSGEAIFSPSIAQRLIDFFSAPQATSSLQFIFPDLTERERGILDLMIQGHTNEQIASHLLISLKTVRNNASNIFSKLQVADRAQAILHAQQAGWKQDHEV